ncbi:Ubiquitin-like protein ATG12 [Teratosphaeria destructans]|uniref:Ubiquitin-like protein ATG12 n=1 Tax=Teratosphaeria destructans TaxID=418781 RepID=A0A9W7SSP8_9PEZI|nr:Ubiquitin-like protein ATG12 [Teratosphaeria destructans]
MATHPSSPSQPPSTSPDLPSPDDPATDNQDLPLPLSASIILDHLPRTTSAALESAGELEQPKVTIRLTPLPGAPMLRQPRFKCSSSQRFEFVVRFLRRKLGVAEGMGVFVYVNSVFAPGLDEGVGNLWRCFKTGDELVVNYSVTQAFG